MKLAGKVAVVTGASSGIGRGAAELFAREGAKVVVADVNEAGGTETVKRITDAGGEAAFVRVDVSDDAQVRNMVDFAVKEFGKLDVQFNNAGVALLGQDGKIADVEEAVWDKVISINLKGVYLCMKYGIREMVKRDGGAVVNTASIAGLVGFPDLAAYCATKGGVIQLTKSAAVDYAAQKVRVNAICPGVIKTAMTEDIQNDPQQMAGLLQATVIGRLGEPEDIAQAAAYLLSDEASFVTGTCLVVDGGYTAL